MKVAITGSNGFIGTALTAALTARGDDVVKIVRGTSAAGDISWDIAAGTIEADKLEGVDAVVHLAGEPIAGAKWTDEQKTRLLESRTKGTSLLVDALSGLENKPSVLLSGSAVGFYGDRGGEALDESSDRGAGFLADVVVAWEEAAAPAAAAGIRVCAVRTGIVLDPSGGALAEQLPFFKLGLGGRIGDGQQFLSWISLDDEIAAILYLLDNKISGPVNLTAPNPVTNGHFTKALGGALNRPTWFPIPRPALNFRLGSEAVEEMLYSSAKIHPQTLTDAGFSFTHETIEEAFDAMF